MLFIYLWNETRKEHRSPLKSSPVLFDHSLNINLQFGIVFADSGSKIPRHKAIKIPFSIHLKRWKIYPESLNAQTNHDQLGQQIDKVYRILFMKTLNRKFPSKSRHSRIVTLKNCTQIIVSFGFAKILSSVSSGSVLFPRPQKSKVE